jgi:hypothetical protein
MVCRHTQPHAHLLSKRLLPTKYVQHLPLGSRSQGADAVCAPITHTITICG